MCKHVAAALYGVGARLDEKPELLFVLRRVDHMELIEQAAAGQALGPAAASDRKTIAEGDLAEVFGIEMDTAVSAANAQPPAQDTVAKVAVDKIAKPQTRRKRIAQCAKTASKPPSSGGNRGGRTNTAGSKTVRRSKASGKSSR